MKLTLHLHSTHQLDWYTLYVRVLSITALVVFAYCVIRVGLLVPDPTLTDATLATRGIHVNTTTYDSLVHYQQTLSTRAAVAIPQFREPF